MLSQGSIHRGYNLDDYLRRYELDNRLFELSVLDCYAGPSSFNAEMHDLQACVTSVDPLYAAHFEDIEEQVAMICQQSSAQISDHDAVGALTQQVKRHAIIDRFLRDFRKGFKQGRYRSEALPFLPFDDHSFEMALCSQCLVLETSTFSETFQIAATMELCRVAKEVRIFSQDDVPKRKPEYFERYVTMLKQEGMAIKVKNRTDSCGQLTGLLITLTPEVVLLP